MEKFEYADKYVSNLNDIPKETHWAILKIASILIPGDERSRTKSAFSTTSTENYIKYEVYLTEDKWKKQVSRRTNDDIYKNQFVAMKVIPAKIEVNVDVTVNE